jgi:large subunit ribosomal protein L6
VERFCSAFDKLEVINMSKIGKRIITLNEETFLTKKDNFLEIKGPKGMLNKKLLPFIEIIFQENKVSFQRMNKSLQSKKNFGTANSLLWNWIKGVNEGFEKELEIKGVGCSVTIKDNRLIIKGLFSHLINFPIPESISITCPTLTKIKVFGLDKELVGDVSAKIRAFKPPIPYPSKRINYVGEKIIRKKIKAKV